MAASTNGKMKTYQWKRSTKAARKDLLFFILIFGKLFLLSMTGWESSPKATADYIHLFVIHLHVCVLMLLGEAVFFNALPRVPNLVDILTTALRAWTVVIITIAMVWFVQGWKYKFTNRQNILSTGLVAVVDLTYLVITSYNLCARTRSWLQYFR